MLDLDKYVERTLEIKINNKTVNLHEISVSDYDEMIDIEAMNGKKGAAAQTAFIVKVLNNNKEGVTFSKEEVYALPKSAINALWMSLITQTLSTVNEKN